MFVGAQAIFVKIENLLMYSCTGDRKFKNESMP